MSVKIGGGKLEENQDHLNKWLNNEPVGPLAIEVGPTYGCNHACVHCGFQQYDPYGKNKNFLDVQAFKDFLDDFHELGGQEVFFAGNGEPLLNPNIAEWSKHGNDLGLRMVMSSNGILMPPKKSDSLLPHMTWIRFSVNGGNAKDYAAVHLCKEKEFDVLVNNLAYGAKLKKELGLKVQLVIQFIVYDLDWNSIPEIVEIHKQVGTDQLIFRNVINKDGSLSIPPDHIRKYLEDAEKVEGVEVRWDTFKRNPDQLHWSKCYAINFRTNMDDKGNLNTCNRNLVKNSVYGNIHDQRFKDIWLNSQKKKKMFNVVTRGTDIPVCGKWCQTTYDNMYLEDYLPAINEKVFSV